MRTALSATFAALACLAAGAALAQATSSIGGSGVAGIEGSAGQTQFKSAAERAMYAENGAAIRGFFTDRDMATMRSDSGVRTAWNDLDPPSRNALAAACRKADDDPGSYSMSTINLCQRVDILQRGGL